MEIVPDIPAPTIPAPPCAFRTCRPRSASRCTVGWAGVSVAEHQKQIAALAAAGIALTRHSFHIFAKHPDEYLTRVDPFVRWARNRKDPLPLIVSEFYRVDTPEWHRLRDSFAFFADRGVPTVMWGFLVSNLFTDPLRRQDGIPPYVDGVLDATNANGTLSFHKALTFAPRSVRDDQAVRAHNGVGGRALWRAAK